VVARSVGGRSVGAPRSIQFSLPFLTEQAKRNILGENARRLFKL
jgi:hypothetical protein